MYHKAWSENWQAPYTVPQSAQVLLLCWQWTTAHERVGWRRNPSTITSSDDVSFALWSFFACGNHTVPFSNRRLLSFGLRIFNQYLDLMEAGNKVQVVYAIVAPT